MQCRNLPLDDEFVLLFPGDLRVKSHWQIWAEEVAFSRQVVLAFLTRARDSGNQRDLIVPDLFIRINTSISLFPCFFSFLVNTTTGPHRDLLPLSLHPPRTAKARANCLCDRFLPVFTGGFPRLRSLTNPTLTFYSSLTPATSEVASSRPDSSTTILTSVALEDLRHLPGCLHLARLLFSFRFFPSSACLFLILVVCHFIICLLTTSLNFIEIILLSRQDFFNC